MRRGRVAKWQCGKGGGMVVAGAWILNGGCSSVPLAADEGGDEKFNLRADIVPDATAKPVVVQVPPAGYSDNWSGMLELEVWGYQTDGWPEIEPLSGSSRPFLYSITTKVDWTSTYLISESARSRLAPFVEPTVSRYLYMVGTGAERPEALVIRWKQRAVARAEVDSAEQDSRIPLPSLRGAP